MANSKYTEDFKKRVALAASDGTSTLKAVGQKFGVSPTLVRNWKLKYNQGENMSEELSAGLVWHIDRAKFSFDDADEYEEWKKEKKVFFEFSPSQSDDSGEAVFADASECEDDFEVTGDRGKVSITLEDDGPVVSAWVKVSADLAEDLDEETLSEWSSDQGGWASCSIHLGPYDASISEDDGGDWRFAEES
jgi:transposase-like protein